MKSLLIIDGNSIINRAFYGIKLLTNKEGMFTNGIYGFLKIMFKNIDEINPDYICVAFDLKKPTFRHKMYDKYKAQRKGMPEELRMQMPVLKEVLMAMNIYVLEKEGFEADDIIGTVSLMCEKENVKCCILTGDRDDLQLASDFTDVYLTVTKMGQTTVDVFNGKKVYDSTGVTPNEFIDVKALMGDQSDNVPGVKGVGEKTAYEYIRKFKSIENLYDNLDDEIIKKSYREKLISGKEDAFLSKKLCTIVRDVDIMCELDDFKKKEYDLERLSVLFNNLEFREFQSKITPKKEKTEIKNKEIMSKEEFKSIFSDIKNEFIYRIYGNLDIVSALFGDTVFYAKKENIDIEILREIFENENVLKISNGIKKDMLCLNNHKINYDKAYFDTSVAAYVISPSKKSYETADISLDFLSESILTEKEVLGSGKSKEDYKSVPKDILIKYVSGETAVLKPLYEYEKEKIASDNQSFLLNDIELPLIRVLADMEISGFKVDENSLKIFSENLSKKLKKLEEEIYTYAGEEFNVNSTKQLGHILFEKLGLKAVKKTKTGYSTDSAVLEKLKGKHPIIECIIEYRINAKLKSTYGDGLLDAINPTTKKLHSSFNQTVTTTGRISSTEPNLQNIPMRRDEGREIRKMFVPSDENKVLIDADYSQIELRILSHIADDEEMQNAFKSGEDIHSSTASKVFGVKKEDVTPLLRSRAKAVNFGIVYGMGEFSLAKDLHISVKEAREYIENYFEKYSNVKKYLDKTVENAKKDGFVTTLFNRRRYIPEINSSNFMTRSFGERVAMNTPIQGTAADIIKIAMVNVSKKLKEEKINAKLILQVHDELIIEADKKDSEKARDILEKCMQNAADLSIPLVAESKEGKSWYEAH